MFDILNKDYYSNKLQVPMLVIQRSKRYWGWFSLSKVWTNKDAQDCKHEITISSEHLKDDVKSIVSTLQHEMVHYANKVAEIKDCSGQVHNKKFKKLAESVGLIVERTKRNGYGCTTCSDEFNEYIDGTLNPDSKCFEYFRMQIADLTPNKKEKTTFTYICPKCDEKIKAKADKAIKCVVCDCEFEMQE